MKKQTQKENKPAKLSEQAIENAHTSGFIREAISESRYFVKEVARSKHTGAKGRIYRQALLLGEL